MLRWKFLHNQTSEVTALDLNPLFRALILSIEGVRTRKCDAGNFGRLNSMSFYQKLANFEEILEKFVLRFSNFKDISLHTNGCRVRVPIIPLFLNLYFFNQAG